jgi:hypothetical protein
VGYERFRVNIYIFSLEEFILFTFGFPRSREMILDNWLRRNVYSDLYYLSLTESRAICKRFHDLLLMSTYEFERLQVLGAGFISAAE